MADRDAVAGASIAVQTYGDFLSFNPHLHAIVSDSCFLNGGDFHMAPGFVLENLEEVAFFSESGPVFYFSLSRVVLYPHDRFDIAYPTG